MKNIILLALFCLLFGFSAKSQTCMNMNTLQLKPDTITTAALVSMVADSNIVSFSIAAKTDETWIEINSDGKKIPETAKQLIFSQKPGAKVCIEHVTASVNGQNKKLPGKVYVIR